MTAAGPSDPRRPRPRRHRVPEERRVDAERTRAALLEAALDEFAAKGFAGARVREIAARAGVSKDLIAYHFDDKDGLYRAVQRAWLHRRTALSAPAASLAEALALFVHDTLTDPRPMRLKIWRGLATTGTAPPDTAGDDHQTTAGIERLQDSGELPREVDPATLQLLLLGAVAAPVAFPDDVRRLFGVDPADPQFDARYRDGLRRLLHLLSGRPPQDGSP